VNLFGDGLQRWDQENNGKKENSRELSLAPAGSPVTEPKHFGFGYELSDLNHPKE